MKPSADVRQTKPEQKQQVSPGPARPEEQETVIQIVKDAQRNPADYLNASEVPEGGE
jgi:hypothetical protein